MLSYPSIVYFAAPVSTYSTNRYGRLLSAARQHFRTADILEARTLFTSNAHWRATWPNLVHRIDALVFIHDGEGFIGRGVWREIADCERNGKPIHFLDDSGRLHPREFFTLGERNERDWRRYARVQAISSVPGVSTRAEAALHAEARALGSRNPRATGQLVRREKHLASAARRRERKDRR